MTSNQKVTKHYMAACHRLVNQVEAGTIHMDEYTPRMNYLYETATDTARTQQSRCQLLDSYLPTGQMTGRIS